MDRPNLAPACAAFVVAALLSSASAPAQGGWGSVPATGAWPPARYEHGLAYDAARDRIVLFSGSNYLGTTCYSQTCCYCGSIYSLGGGRLLDTWEWDGTAWSLIPVANPPGSLGIMPFDPRILAYDAARQVCLLVAPSIFSNQVHQWNGTAWTSVAIPGTFAFESGFRAAAFDRARGLMVYMGQGKILEWNGVTMNLVSNSGPNIASAAYDDSRAVTVALVEGASGIATWEWNGAAITQRTPAHSPPARVGAAIAYDPGRGRVVLHGGAAPSNLNLALADVWEWDGNDWTQPSMQTTPSPRLGHRMVYHSGADRIVSFGGRTTTIYPNVSCPPIILGQPSTSCQPVINQCLGDMSVYEPACGSGQANGSLARLVVNGLGGFAACPGPFNLNVKTPSTVRVDWYGPAGQPVLLLAGPLNPANTLLGCSGWVDLGTPPQFADLVMLFDGVSDPQYRLDSNGRARQQFLLPLLPPQLPLISVQGAVIQAPGSTCPLIITAAFHLRTI